MIGGSHCFWACGGKTIGSRYRVVYKRQRTRKELSLPAMGERPMTQLPPAKPCLL